MTDIVILTNGTLLTEESVLPLKGLVDVISLSFDGASAASPAHIRGTQLFDRLVEGVRLVQRAGIGAHILATVHARNVDEVPAYIQLASELGATAGFSLLSGSRRELGDLAPEPPCLAHLAEVMAAQPVGEGAADADDRVLRDEDVRPGSLRARARCGAGRTGVSVAADGSVYPCHMLHYPQLRLGDAFHDTADALRAALDSFVLPAVDDVEGCQGCDKRYLCGGGCRGRSMAEYGRMDARDPYCAFYDRAIDLMVDSFLAKATI